MPAGWQAAARPNAPVEGLGLLSLVTVPSRAEFRFRGRGGMKFYSSQAPVREVHHAKARDSELGVECDSAL